MNSFSHHLLKNIFILLIIIPIRVNAEFFELEKHMPESIKAQLKLNGINSVYGWSTGKLDDTGVDYYAILSTEAIDEKDADYVASVRLFLFSIQQDGNLKEILKSNKLRPCASSVHINFCQLDIDKNSIFILSDYVFNWACSYNNITKQYKKTNAGFVLIGEERVVSDCESNESEVQIKEVSINYLSKKKITTIKKSQSAWKKPKLSSENIVSMIPDKIYTLEEDYGSEVSYEK